VPDPGGVDEVVGLEAGVARCPVGMGVVIGAEDESGHERAGTVPGIGVIGVEPALGRLRDDESPARGSNSGKVDPAVPARDVDPLEIRRRGVLNRRLAA
jgi:hypothetical protein